MELTDRQMELQVVMVKVLKEEGKVHMEPEAELEILEA